MTQKTPPRPARFAVAQIKPVPAPDDWQPYLGGMSYSVLRTGTAASELRELAQKNKRALKHSRNHRRTRAERITLAVRRHRDEVRALRRKPAEAAA